jgi:hypothetical protein
VVAQARSAVTLVVSVPACCQRASLRQRSVAVATIYRRGGAGPVGSNACCQRASLLSACVAVATICRCGNYLFVPALADVVDVGAVEPRPDRDSRAGDSVCALGARRNPSDPDGSIITVNGDNATVTLV